MPIFWVMLVLADPGPLRGSALDAALAAPLTVRWKPRTLHSALDELAEKLQFNLVVDRRVDRDYTVFGDLTNLPLEDALGMLVKLVGARMVLIGDIVYVGPDELADRAATQHVLYQRSKPDLSEELRARLTEPTDLLFDPQRTVREVVAPLIAHLGLETAAGALPDVEVPVGRVRGAAPEDLLTVLLAQLDRTFTIDEASRRLSVVPIPPNPTYAVTLRLPRAKARATARQYQDAAGGLEVAVEGLNFTARGRWSQQRALSRQLAKTAHPAATTKGRTATTGRKAPTYTLSMRNVSVQTFAAKLAETTGKTVRIDEPSLRAAGKSKLDRLSCAVSNLTLEELLKQVLQPMDLSYRIGTKEIVILAPPAMP